MMMIQPILSYLNLHDDDGNKCDNYGDHYDEDGDSGFDDCVDGYNDDDDDDDGNEIDDVNQGDGLAATANHILAHGYLKTS